VASQIFEQLARAMRGNELTWRYLFNFAPTLGYRLSRRPLSRTVTGVLKDLNRDGIAMASVESLFGEKSCYDELASSVERLELERVAELAAARETANREDASRTEKSFILPLLGPRPLLDITNVWVRFALQKPLLRVANAYFGMYTRLRYYNVWHTFTTRGESRSSQLWHHDRDDLFYILKVFVYLSDVDEGAGPLTYAAGTHSKGKARRQPSYLYKEGATTRSDDSQMAQVVPPEQWVKAVGPRGTIVFADTRGYHKGGLAREHDRIMYVCMFTSPSAPLDQVGELFERPAGIVLPQDPGQAFALSPSGRGK